MAIEIRELHIKAVIDSGKTGTIKTASNGAPMPQPATGETPDQLVDICVEKVLEILKEKAER